MFSLQPELLEEKIDVILDLLGERAKDWKVASFTDAFSSFLQFYIMSNKDRTNREAVIDNEQSNLLLTRMVRSIFQCTVHYSITICRSLEVVTYLATSTKHRILQKSS